MSVCAVGGGGRWASSQSDTNSSPCDRSQTINAVQRRQSAPEALSPATVSAPMEQPY